MKQKVLGSLLLLSFISSCISVWMMSSGRKELVIAGKTNALFSLEVAWSKQRVEEVKQLWSDRLDTAIKLNYTDFYLIVSYISFLITGFLFLARSIAAFFSRHQKKFLMLAMSAGLFDIAEGIAADFWLKGHIDSFSPPVITILSIAKFIIAVPLLFLVIGGLMKFIWNSIKKVPPDGSTYKEKPL